MGYNINYTYHCKGCKRDVPSEVELDECPYCGFAAFWEWDNKEETKMTEEKLNLEFFVAGVKFRKDWKKNLEELEEGQELCLAREPENRFDREENSTESNAVQILHYKVGADGYGDEIGTMLGYVPAKTGESKIVSRALKEGRSLTAIITEVSPDFEPWTSLRVRITAPEFMSDEEVTEDA